MHIDSDDAWDSDGNYRGGGQRGGNDSDSDDWLRQAPPRKPPQRPAAPAQPAPALFPVQRRPDRGEPATGAAAMATAPLQQRSGKGAPMEEPAAVSVQQGKLGAGAPAADRARALQEQLGGAADKASKQLPEGAAGADDDD